MRSQRPPCFADIVRTDQREATGLVLEVAVAGEETALARSDGNALMP